MSLFDCHTREIIARTAAFLAESRVPAYIVGGALRDALLGLPSADVDIALDGSPHRLGPRLASLLGGRFVSLDSSRDVARVIVRVIVRERARSAFIDLSAMQGGSIDADLRRRDFTIDALGLDLSSALSGDWKPMDPLGGSRDIRARLIRAASETAFTDDPIRLMRAVRLAAETGFAIESATQAMIRRHALHLRRSSAERVREELLRTLALPAAGRWLRMMDSLGILSAILPELDAARGVTQPKEHYYDVFGHLLAAVDFADQIASENYPPPLIGKMMPRFEGMSAHFRQEVTDGHSRGTILKLVALLHDIAKPQTKTVEPSGRVRFFGHSEKGEETAGVILTRLRVGRRGTRLAQTMIRHHLRPRQMAGRGELPTDRAIHRYYRDLADAALDTLYLNMADFLAARGPLLTPAEMERQATVIGHILAVGPQRRTPPSRRVALLTGHDIMRELRLDSGPAVGRLLRVVAEAEAGGQVKNREEALTLARTHLAAGGGGG